MLYARTIVPACGAVLLLATIFHEALGQDGNAGNEYPYRPGVIPSGLNQEIKRVESEIDQIEHEAMAEWRAIPAGTSSQMRQVRILGKLLLFDKNLSVNKNEACSFCHMPDTDFTGPISSLNLTTVSYPGSVRHRFGHRKPQSYTYAPFFPALLYNESQKDFYGGNFWDLRATGYRLQNPAAEQAQDPPVDPNEMGMSDSACVVLRLSQSLYRALFETVWANRHLSSRGHGTWNRSAASLARLPRTNPYPVHLSKADRGRTKSTYDQFALSIAMYEASPEVSPFTSKFDYALANSDKQVLSADELAGWNLFRGRGMCNTCHLDGTANSAKQRNPGPIGPGNAASVAPLFTDFTSSI